MLARKITEARKKHEEIVHKPQLKSITTIALNKVAQNYLLYKELPNLPQAYKEKVYDLMSVNYKIEDTFPIIEYEPFWERSCREHFKSDDCSLNGNSWKQCYAENYVKNLISSYKGNNKNEEENQKEFNELKNVCQIVKFYIFNLDIPTFSFNFDISHIPRFFLNLTSLHLKYSPILKEKRPSPGSFSSDPFSKKLEPIGDEYSEFGIRIPDLKKFCISITELNYFLSLSLQGNLVDDEMIKWLVPGLITNQTLRYLDLSSNKITEKGMIKISSYLVRTKSLLTLDLSNNLIGGESSYAIGLVLKENTRLKELKLAMNRLDDVNGGKIVKMLARNEYLELLDLSTNKLSVETLSNLNLALKYNNDIKIIVLSHTDIEIDDETIKIAQLHPQLRELDVNHTKSSEEKIKELESLLIKKTIDLKLNKRQPKIK